jgi:hypothetical protein
MKEIRDACRRAATAPQQIRLFLGKEAQKIYCGTGDALALRLRYGTVLPAGDSMKGVVIR